MNPEPHCFGQNSLLFGKSVKTWNDGQKTNERIPALAVPGTPYYPYENRLRLSQAAVQPANRRMICTLNRPMASGIVIAGINARDECTTSQVIQTSLQGKELQTSHHGEYWSGLYEQGLQPVTTDDFIHAIQTLPLTLRTFPSPSKIDSIQPSSRYEQPLAQCTNFIQQIQTRYPRVVPFKKPLILIDVVYDIYSLTGPFSLSKFENRGWGKREKKREEGDRRENNYV